MSLHIFCAEENKERTVEKMWEFSRKHLTLTCLKEPHYWVDLERCRTGSEVMDWIFQLMWKNWVTPDVIFSFLKEFEHCFKEVFGTNSQAMCSGGDDFVVNWKRGKIERKKN